MNAEQLKKIFRKWRSDYDFKTFTGASVSLAATLAFALYNGFLGLSLSSVWHGSICVYYIILLVLRASILSAEKRTAPEGDGDLHRRRACVIASVWLLVLNIALIVPISILARQKNPENMTLIPALAMAAYTTYKITMASVNLKRRHTSANHLVRLLRYINFIDALVSIMTLQNTLIMLNSKGADPNMLPFTILSNGIIMLVIILLSVSALVRNIRSLRAKRSLPG